jgi:hypothetical protein
MPLEIQVLPPLDTMSSRANEVRTQLSQIKVSLMETKLILGRLLKEARDNQYNLLWGFHRFGAWVEEGSGLDLSERSAYDMISVVEMANALEIPDEQLHRVKFSKLKAIASLPDDTDPDVVRGLVRDAEEAPLKSVQEAVGLLKNQAYVYTTLKFERDAYDNVWLPGVEKARRMYGNTIGFQGDLADIEQSRAAELMAASLLAEPDESEEGELLDAEYIDVLLPEAA